MRVLLCTPDFPPSTGGIQLLLERLAEHSRHQVRVVTVAGPRSAQAESSLKVVRAARLPVHRAEILALNCETLRQARAWRPRAIICGHVVVAPAALAAGRLVGAPVLQYLYSDELRRRHQLARFAVGRATASIAISRHTSEQALGLGVDHDRLHQIPPGVDLADLKEPSASDLASMRPTIVTVSRMEERYKGFDVMLRALPLVRRRIPNVRWVVIGDGPLRDSLHSTSSRWGLNGICVFAGRVSDAERNAWLSRSHVFALPSRVTSCRGGGEGFGIVYLEAGAHFLPSLAGEGSGAADAVDHGETGLLVDPYDHVAVAEALMELLTNPAQACAMGRAGRRRAEKYTWTRMAHAVDELLESVCGTAHSVR